MGSRSGRSRRFLRIPRRSRGTGLFQKIGEFPLSTDPEHPIAEDAIDYYKNGPSYLNRYFPFWIANYLRQIITVLVTTSPITLLAIDYGPGFTAGICASTSGLCTGVSGWLSWNCKEILVSTMAPWRTNAPWLSA
jgi:hypothetical protein